MGYSNVANVVKSARVEVIFWSMLKFMWIIFHSLASCVTRHSGQETQGKFIFGDIIKNNKFNNPPISLMINIPLNITGFRLILAY